jgi:hypothetical protein
MSVPIFDRPSVAERTEAQHRGYGDKERYNSLENGGSRYANSPLLDLPIRQVMGDAHYLPQPALSEVPGRGGAGMAGRA